MHFKQHIIFDQNKITQEAYQVELSFQSARGKIQKKSNGGAKVVLKCLATQIETTCVDVTCLS